MSNTDQALNDLLRTLNHISPVAPDAWAALAALPKARRVSAQ